MPTFFLSYARKDLNLVYEIYFALRDNPRFKLWFDIEDIRPTLYWEDEIKRGLDSCDAVILIASRFSLSSLFVAREWQYALEQGKPVYAWVIDDCAVSKLAEMPRVTLLDLRADPFDVPQWKAAVDGWLEDAPPTTPAAAFRRPKLPAYVRTFIRRVGTAQVVFSLLAFAILGLFAPAHEPIITLLGLPLLVADACLGVWFLGRLRRRLLVSRSWVSWFLVVCMGKWFLTFYLQLYTTLPVPDIWGGNTIIGIFVVVFLLFSVFNRLWLGDYAFEYRNPANEQTLQQQFAQAQYLLPIYHWLQFPRYRRSKLRGWLPAYASSIITRNGFAKDDSFFKNHQLRPRPSHQAMRVAVLHSAADAPFANWLADVLDYPVRPTCHLLEQSLDADGFDDSDVLVAVISPFSLNTLEEMIAKRGWGSNQLWVNILFRDTDIPDKSPLSASQWIDARRNYWEAVEILRKRLRGENFYTATGDVPPRSFGLLLNPMMWVLYWPILMIGLVWVLFLAFAPLVSLLVPLIDPVRLYSVQVAATYVPLIAVYSLLFLTFMVSTIRGRPASIELTAALSALYLIPVALINMFQIAAVGWLTIGGFLYLMHKSRHDILKRPARYGFDDLVISALITRPNLRFERRRFGLHVVATVLLIGTILLCEAGIARDPLGRYKPNWYNSVIPNATGVEIRGVLAGTEIVQTEAGGLSIPNPSHQFANIQRIHLLLILRQIAEGAKITFNLYYEGQQFETLSMLWDKQVDWAANPDIEGYFTQYLENTAQPIAPGYYELYVLINDVSVAHTVFTIIE